MPDSPLHPDPDWFKPWFFLSPDPCWVIEDGLIAECNDAALRALGYACREDLIGVHPARLSPPVQPGGEDSYAQCERLLALTREAGWQRFEWVHVRADGTRLQSELTLTWAGIAQRQVFFAVWRDITERLAAQALLREREQHLKRVLEGSDQSFWDWNLLTNVFVVSPRFETMLGFAPGELDVSVANWSATVQQDDLARAVASIERHLAGQSATHEVELRCRTKSGGWCWLLTRGRIVERGADGQPLMMSGTHTDITERKLAEQALRDSQERFSLLASATFEGVALSEQGRVVDANAQLLTLLGCSRDELIGQPLVSYVALSDRARVIRHMQEGAGNPIEHAVICRDGQRLEVENRGRAIQGKGSGAHLTIVRDITQRKREADLLRQALLDVEKADHAKSRFLAAASHDLRQPLFALGLYTGMLKNATPAPDPKVLENIDLCIASLSELLNDLLDLSKLEAGVVRPGISHFAVSALWATLESVHAPEARAKGLRLRFVPSSLTANTDLVLLRRALGNLIGNALAFTAHGGVVVACRRARGRTWIEVWDTGIGIAADKTDEIFEEFKQLGDGARNKGSGLGLAIVARTAALLGLEIRVRSRPGLGSVFAIELPLAAPVPALPATAQRPSAWRALRIALVEDNAMVRAALVGGLEKLGHQVLATADQAALLAQLASQSPDILVSDFRLAQGETGIDVIAAVRARFGTGLPAVLITGDTDPALLRRMASLGIVVLHKPVALQDLQRCFEGLVEASTADPEA